MRALGINLVLGTSRLPQTAAAPAENLFGVAPHHVLKSLVVLVASVTRSSPRLTGAANQQSYKRQHGGHGAVPSRDETQSLQDTQLPRTKRFQDKAHEWTTPES